MAKSRKERGLQGERKTYPSLYCLSLKYKKESLYLNCNNNLF